MKLVPTIIKNDIAIKPLNPLVTWKPNDIVYCYKPLQIIGSQINLCYRSIILPTMLCMVVSGNVFGASLTLTLKSDLLNNPANFLYPFFAIESTIVIFGLGTLAGLVNKRSSGYITMITRKPIKSDLLFKKIAKSCPSIKIRFSSNFMAMSTPLVMANFCAKTTARLLLMK
ncbi:hypothetical protein Fcan01_16870 [Folsomia candida]|uniref:Uncharacterized protein n=1 Tax=Folsomia candida TaxID=158441 RepID=A0A226DSV8_FOLCA|nr:hypothetical protein Fcan01_16870 [Folsomia candida]